MSKCIPLVSVVVPVYNVEEYLDRCIDSITRQTYPNIEIILIDDGSTDKSGIICDYYQVRDERIIVIHQENAGLSAARNSGINRAKGDWILFVDSDDCINVFTIEKCLQYASQEQDVDIVHFEYMNCYDMKNKDYENAPDKIFLDVKDGRTATKKSLMTSGDVVVWNKLYRRELFRNIRFPVGKIHEDEFVTHKLIYEARKVLYLSGTFYYYSIRDNSIMRSKFDERKLVLLEAFEERLAYFKQQAENDLYEYTMMQYYQVLRTVYMLLQVTEHRCVREYIYQILKENSSKFMRNRYLGVLHKVILKTSTIFPCALNLYRLKYNLLRGTK